MIRKIYLLAENLCRINIVPKAKHTDIAIFLLLVCASGAVSVKLGQDFSFDLRNYHLYNSYAMVNNRLLFDIDAITIQRYFNPLLDLPYYFFVKFLNNYPRLVSFLQGTFLGMLLFFVYKIFLNITGNKENSRFITLLLLIGAGTGAITISELGTVFNDIQIGLLVIFALFLFILKLDLPKKKIERGLLLPAIVLGISFGLKLTAGIYVIGMLFAILITTRLNLKALSITIIGLIIGFSISGGYWACILWEKFGNPIFPYYNTIFKSEYWLNGNLIDARFFPRDILQWLFYPFYWIKKNNGMVTERWFSDPRVAGGIISMLIIIVYMFKHKVVRESDRPARMKMSFLITFQFFSYIAWILQFSIYRYAVLLEILSVLILFIAIDLTIEHSRIRNTILSIVLLCYIALTSYPDWGRVLYSDKMYNVSIPNIEKHSIIVVDAHSRPQPWLFLFFDKTNRFFIFSDPKHNSSNKLYELALSELDHHNGPIYLLSSPKLSPIESLPVILKYGEITELGKIEARVGKILIVPYNLYRITKKE